jgi:2-succinyl-6-hydroxy-2,4-cyclohexadiene-1-carboxylate synthase
LNKVKLQVNGVEYRVLEAGAGEEAVMLLHGFTGRIENWRDQIALFSQDHRVIVIDLLGHGDTDAPDEVRRYAIEEAAADLIAVLDQLGVAQVNLLGYSMGGRLALYIALHFPQLVKRLILESASPGLEDISEREARVKSDEALAAFIEQEGIEAFVQRWEALPLFATQQALSEGVRLQHRQLRLQNNPVGLANSLRGMGTGVQPSLWQKLNHLSMPMLLIVGELDTKFTQIAYRMEAQTPQTEMRVVPQAGHTVHLEQPALYNRIVLDFLARD